PMMRTVLADLALQVEAAVALVMRLCRAVDRAGADPLEAARARLLIPAAKYLVCKAAPGFIYEALECLGGNGYVEEGVMARLYREAPLNAIWEGSGNVMCLDVLRALGRDGTAARAVIGELAGGAAELPGTAEAASFIIDTLSDPGSEARARSAVERVARLAAAGALAESAPVGIAESFARTRLAAPRGATYGTAALDGSLVTRLLDRALP